MMMALYGVKARIKNFFEKNDRWIRPLMHVILASTIYFMLITEYPYRTEVAKYAVPMILLLAVVGAFFPIGVSAFFATVLIFMEISKVSYIAAAGAGLIVLIYLLLLGRFSSYQSVVIIAMIALWKWNVIGAVPLIAGLMFAPTMIPACAMGVVFHYILESFEDYYQYSQGIVDQENTLQGLQHLFQYIMGKKEIYVYAIAISLTLLVTYVIRKMKFSYSSYVGISVGAVIYALSVIELGNLFKVENIHLGTVTSGTLIGLCIAIVVQFFRFSLDYHRARRLQFEDDDYYYYVDAIPKLKISKGEKQVTHLK